MQTATYKGYTGKFEINFEDNLISGIVIDIKDVITFHGHTIEEVLQCFHELGEAPEKPFSGKLPYRTTPEIHRRIYLAATKAGKSVNAWMDEVLSQKAKDLVG
jgi:predicted HicB family RNase H-like nuclease